MLLSAGFALIDGRQCPLRRAGLTKPRQKMPEAKAACGIGEGGTRTLRTEQEATFGAPGIATNGARSH